MIAGRPCFTCLRASFCGCSYGCSGQFAPLTGVFGCPQELELVRLAGVPPEILASSVFGEEHSLFAKMFFKGSCVFSCLQGLQGVGEVFQVGKEKFLFNLTDRPVCCPKQIDVACLSPKSMAEGRHMFERRAGRLALPRWTSQVAQLAERLGAHGDAPEPLCDPFLALLLCMSDTNARSFRYPTKAGLSILSCSLRLMLLRPLSASSVESAQISYSQL